MSSLLATRLFRAGFLLGAIGLLLNGLGLGAAAGGYGPIRMMIWIGFALALALSGGVLLAFWYPWFKRRGEHPPGDVGSRRQSSRCPFRSRDWTTTRDRVVAQFELDA